MSDRRASKAGGKAGKMKALEMTVGGVTRRFKGDRAFARVGARM